MNLRPFITLALIIGFSAIAIFGAFAMGQSAGDQNACIAATVNGLTCIVPTDLASIASGYLSAFGTFSSAWFSAISLLILFVTALLTLTYLGLTRQASARVVRISDITESQSKRQTLAWISRHEQSPNDR